MSETVALSDERTLVWLASYPKSGNTWVRAMVDAVLHPANPAGLDALTGSASHHGRQWLDDFAGVSSAEMHPEELIAFQAMFYRDMAARAEGPRFCKTHSAWLRDTEGIALFPRDACAGAIHILRNPIDIVPSFAHHEDRSFDRIIAMMADEGMELDRWPDGAGRTLPQRLGSWSTHTRSWGEGCDFPLLTVRYEDLVADPAAGLARILDFCRIDRSPDAIRRAVAATQFDKLRQAEERGGYLEKPSESRVFFRGGRTGDGARVLTRKQTETVLADHGQTMAAIGYPVRAEDYGADPA